MTTTELQAGFADPVAGSQSAFRSLMNAFAYPGTVQNVLPPHGMPAPLSAAVTAALLTLADGDTPLWLDEKADTPGVRSYIAFHCGAPVTPDIAAARFAIITEPGAMPALNSFHPGEPAFPDRSATLIVQAPSLEGGGAVTLTGPGIETSRGIAPQGLPGGFWEQWDKNRQLFPCGVDLLLSAEDGILALPRTTKADPSERKA